MSRRDVIVLGGGIIGCATAWELAERGKAVCLLERGTVGCEASTAAAGILSSQMDVEQPGPFFELCQASRRLYPRWITRLEQHSRISVGFHVDGIVFLAVTESEERRMARQARWQTARGLRVERWSSREVRRREPSVDGRVRCGFSFPTEAQIDNGRLMQALAVACRKARVDLRERTTIRRLRIRHGRVRGVETDHGPLEAPVVVNCLGSWASMGGAFPLTLPVEPARGQMLAFAGPKRLLRHVVMSERAYAVQRRDGRVLVGSTIERAGFDKSLTLEGIHAILCGIRHMSRALDRCTFREAWAGFRPSTPDRLPILGSTPIDGLYVATGHFRHGILLAPLTAQVLAELILTGRSSPDLTPFSPQRFVKK
ncbi:MAG: glycine oxidase ThiO [Candidatus Omnitrophota bacterium]|nr:glycine oxidase ThiO [Candidatus Omnitrophota bacterium]